jgi:hypothetical protein
VVAIEGCRKQGRAPVQNVGGLCSDVEPSGRSAELCIDIGCFDLRRGGRHAKSQAHSAFVDAANDPLVK